MQKKEKIWAGLKPGYKNVLIQPYNYILVVFMSMGTKTTRHKGGTGTRSMKVLVTIKLLYDLITQRKGRLISGGGGGQGKLMGELDIFQYTLTWHYNLGGGGLNQNVMVNHDCTTVPLEFASGVGLKYSSIVIR